MADIFTNDDFKALLTGKRIVFFGDSNMRAIYKDWLWLFQSNTILPEHCLKSKLEPSFADDSLIAGSTLHNGRHYREIREYQNSSIYMLFVFLTRCITDDLQLLFAEFKSGAKPAPDIVIFNSCLWDLTRWGPNGVTEYQRNMAELMLLMHDSFPLKTLVLFTTTLPVSLQMKGAFLVPEVKFLHSYIPFDVMEANQFLRGLVVAHGFDVVDLHFHLQYQIHRRLRDGVHWESIAIRHLTNLLLTHISVSLRVKLPGNMLPYALRRTDCVESADWIGQTVDHRLSAPVPTLTLEDFEDIGSNRSTSSSYSSDNLRRLQDVLNENRGKNVCKHNVCETAPVMENLYENPKSMYGIERGRHNRVDSSAGLVLKQGNNAPMSSFGNRRMSACASSSSDNSRKFHNVLPIPDKNCPEIPKQPYENSGKNVHKHNVCETAPVMENLYENPKSMYGIERGRHNRVDSSAGLVLKQGNNAPMSSFGNRRMSACASSSSDNSRKFHNVLPIPDNNCPEIPMQPYENSGKNVHKHNVCETAPVMENLYENPKSMYGIERGRHNRVDSSDGLVLKQGNNAPMFSFGNRRMSACSSYSSDNSRRLQDVLNENRGKNVCKHNVCETAPVMENLYENPKSMYGIERGRHNRVDSSAGLVLKQGNNAPISSFGNRRMSACSSSSSDNSRKFHNVLPIPDKNCPKIPMQPYENSGKNVHKLNVCETAPVMENLYENPKSMYGIERGRHNRVDCSDGLVLKQGNNAPMFSFGNRRMSACSSYSSDNSRKFHNVLPIPDKNCPEIPMQPYENSGKNVHKLNVCETAPVVENLYENPKSMYGIERGRHNWVDSSAGLVLKQGNNAPMSSFGNRRMSAYSSSSSDNSRKFHNVLPIPDKNCPEIPMQPYENSGKNVHKLNVCETASVMENLYENPKSMYGMERGRHNRVDCSDGLVLKQGNNAQMSSFGNRRMSAHKQDARDHPQIFENLPKNTVQSFENRRGHTVTDLRDIYEARKFSPKQPKVTKNK